MISTRNLSDTDLAVAALREPCRHALPSVVRALGARLAVSLTRTSELAAENEALKAQLQRIQGHDA